MVKQEITGKIEESAGHAIKPGADQVNGKPQAHQRHFDEEHVLHELKHFLPSQTPLKDFIHHNTLHAFQHMKFYDAIFKASKMFGYQVTLQLGEYRKLCEDGRIRMDVLERIIREKKGAGAVEEWKEKLLRKTYDDTNTPRVGAFRENWRHACNVSPDQLVHPVLFRVLGCYLDQGIAGWKFPVTDKGFLDALREMEKNSFVSIFKTKRAKDLLMNSSCELAGLLKIVVGDEAYYTQYIFDQQFAHHGWSGIVSSIEDFPNNLLDPRKITLRELIAFELLLEIDALDFSLGKSWQPLSRYVQAPAADLFAEVPHSELRDVFMLWQDAFEWSYYDNVLAGIRAGKKQDLPSPAKKNFQAYFCIDERECSLRRHIESVDPSCETLGAPGFYAAEFYFQPENGKFYEKLCPAPVTPKYLIKEYSVPDKRGHETLYTRLNQNLVAGTFITLGLGFWAGIKLALTLFRPKMTPAISNAYTHMHKRSKLTIENKNPEDRENGLQIGFTVTEMADRVEGLLRGTGLTEDFAPLVYVLAHGSSSANNPHHSAHDCGACSGRPGSVNARVFAFMANHAGVREILAQRGITVPASTQFVGGLHDTAADQVQFYDDDALSPENAAAHKKHVASFEQALNRNAKERSRRFASINTKQSLEGAREAIRLRSVSMFEPRPELGHGTNSLCIVGRRNMTKGLFLDRRAFLNSYDYRTDPEGKLLVGVMRPLGIVCGGINLEYYFSRVDNHKLGAGTKLPHHVLGLVGVTNSADGDLRPGLPVQMIEVHDPVRLLLIVEHYPEVVLKTVQSSPEMYEWYINDWVHLAAIHPDTNEVHYFRDGKFSVYTPLTESLPVVDDLMALIESAKKMETNQIVDATKENLPVYLLK